ncbi:nucleotidyltransferase [Thermus scotoductus]|uniref:Nucleotidyltransferase n=2 Tax=Thermus scotoductus TaxID=37636 RepID=A0A430UID1_THESC|nr:nucleotidyltransferase [Thermus scotoductus]
MPQVSPELEQLITRLREAKTELRDRFGVREISLFGSRVRGEGRPTSDLDLLVEFERAPGLLRFLELEEYLSQLLGIQVDLVRKASVREELRAEILGEAVLVE